MFPGIWTNRVWNNICAWRLLILLVYSSLGHSVGFSPLDYQLIFQLNLSFLYLHEYWHWQSEKWKKLFKNNWQAIHWEVFGLNKKILTQMKKQYALVSSSNVKKACRKVNSLCLYFGEILQRRSNRETLFNWNETYKVSSNFVSILRLKQS